MRPFARYPKAAVGDFDGQPSRVTEMDALVAYLQILGRMVDFTASAPRTSGSRRGGGRLAPVPEAVLGVWMIACSSASSPGSLAEPATGDGRQRAHPVPG